MQNKNNKDFLLSIPQLLDFVAMNNVQEKKLKILPKESNYLMEVKITEFDIARNIIEIYNKLGTTNTLLSDHLSVINPREDCYLNFDEHHYNYLCSLVNNQKHTN